MKHHTVCHEASHSMMSWSITVWCHEASHSMMSCMKHHTVWCH